MTFLPSLIKDESKVKRSFLKRQQQSASSPHEMMQIALYNAVSVSRKTLYSGAKLNEENNFIAGLR